MNHRDRSARTLHAPEVVSLAKGKAHKPYEFGAKIALAVTTREGFALPAQARSGNRMTAAPSPQPSSRSSP